MNKISIGLIIAIGLFGGVAEGLLVRQLGGSSDRATAAVGGMQPGSMGRATAAVGGMQPGSMGSFEYGDGCDTDFGVFSPIGFVAPVGSPCQAAPGGQLVMGRVVVGTGGIATFGWWDRDVRVRGPNVPSALATPDAPRMGS